MISLLGLACLSKALDAGPVARPTRYPRKMDKATRQELNRSPATRVGGDPSDEREHFVTCPECGQQVDMRKLGDVLWHEEEGHKPIPPDA